MTENKKSIFAQRLADRRKELGLAQDTLGMAIGTEDPASAKTQISRYENDHHEPNFATLGALARQLNVSADYLIGITTIKAGLQNESDLSPDDFGALQEFRQGRIESLIDRWKKRFKKP